jgi:hypothetical protein
MSYRKGKLLSFLILLILLVPLFVSIAIFHHGEVLGVSSRADITPANNFRISNPLDGVPLKILSDDPATIVANRNSDMTSAFDKNGQPDTGDKKPFGVNENADTDLMENVARRFNTKLIVRDQKEEAVSNTFTSLKTSYDLIYGKNIATVFVVNNDPKLSEANAIAINFTIAKRLGIDINKEKQFDVSVLQKK